jgi:hypothetical protein
VLLFAIFFASRIAYASRHFCRIASIRIPKMETKN